MISLSCSRVLYPAFVYGKWRSTGLVACESLNGANLSPYRRGVLLQPISGPCNCRCIYKKNVYFQEAFCFSLFFERINDYFLFWYCLLLLLQLVLFCVFPCNVAFINGVYFLCFFFYSFQVQNKDFSNQFKMNPQLFGPETENVTINQWPLTHSILLRGLVEHREKEKQTHKEATGTQLEVSKGSKVFIRR